MNIFLYCIIGIIGVLFGSFFTLAVYRIPLGENIIYKRSYCPKCKHKLNFWDLIPVLSYVFLNGKCRYCKEPIHKRYIIFELLSGFLFVIFAYIIGISSDSSYIELILFVHNVLSLSLLVIICGIAIEKDILNNSVILFGILMRTIYLVFFNQYIFNNYFMQALQILLVFLIIYYLMCCIFRKTNMHFDKLYSYILLVCYITYMFGIGITLIIIVVNMLVSFIYRYILKKKNNMIVNISILSIFVLVINNIAYFNDILKIISNGWIL